MIEHRIFFSWQSDTRAASNRTLIGDALEMAVSAIVGFGNTKVEFVIDRDTVGIPGSPDIASTILSKIDASAILIADITMVDALPAHIGSARRFPNPNVLVEVGYAIGRLGFASIILLFNTYFGKIEELPFDLRGRRVISYYCDPAVSERAQTKKDLTNKIKLSITSILSVRDDVIPDDEGQDTSYIREIRSEIQSMYQQSAEQISITFPKIEEKLKHRSIDDETYASLVNRILELFSKRSEIPLDNLLRLTDIALYKAPSANGYFYRGLLSGRLQRPYDSIGAYMKAIDLGDPNPSLCFLNAGNRYRELNDDMIAIAFFEKSVSINPLQANAWLAAAQLYAKSGQIQAAKRCYQGYIDWYQNLPQSAMIAPRSQQADEAKAYLLLRS